MIVGTAQLPITRSGGRTPAFASSSAIASCSIGVAARPYGLGQCGAMSPASASATRRALGSSGSDDSTSRTWRRSGSASGPISMWRWRRRPVRPIAVTRAFHDAVPPHSARIAIARRSERWASCSHVKPMPPWIWMQSLALSTASCTATAPAVAAASSSCRRSSVESSPRDDVAGGNGRIPGCCGGKLAAGEHVGAQVLDRLEAADGAAELLAHLRVRRGGLLRPARDAGGLGRGDGDVQVADQAGVEAGEHVLGAARSRPRA